MSDVPRSMRVLLALIVSVVLVACGRSADDSSPSGAARLFVAAMAQSADDRHGLEDAYHLLSEASRQRLVERARETAALGAREREPWEMLVEGTAHVRFEPRPSGYREQIDPSDPSEATVTISGPHDGDRAELALVREDDGWRVVLDLPDATPPAE